MITQVEWDKLKQHEAYGMYLALMNKIDKLMLAFDDLDYDYKELQKRVNILEQNEEKVN